jgi:transposase InsO family protein
MNARDAVQQSSDLTARCFDTLDDGRPFRILVLVDDCTGACLALVVDTSLSEQRVARELDRIIAGRGKQLRIVSDTGTRLASPRKAAALKAQEAAQEIELARLQRIGQARLAANRQVTAHLAHC